MSLGPRRRPEGARAGRLGGRPGPRRRRHLPGETVDLLHVEAAGGAVPQGQGYEVEVIEGGPRPGPPLLAAGSPEPRTLEGGPLVRGRERHRGAVVLVRSLLFCELEGHRAGAALTPASSAAQGTIRTGPREGTAGS